MAKPDRDRHHAGTMLELRPNCEWCDCDLPPDSLEARICSYECTFCARCAETTLANVCPNCGGGFVPRPIRPRQAWREGAGLSAHPASTERRQRRRNDHEADELIARVAGRQPEDR